MGVRRWQDVATIFGLLHGAFLFHLATSQSFIGVNYGTIADNLPPVTSTASLLMSTSIGKLRLYEPQPDLVAALAGSDISILLGVPNSDVPNLASSPAAAVSWAAANVPTTVPVSAISVGNELLNSGDPTLGPQLLPAMQNLLAALPAGSTTKGTPQSRRGMTPTGFCVTTAGVPGSTQGQKVPQSSSCYLPAGAVSRRADAGTRQFVCFGVLLCLAMVVAK